MGSSGAGLYSQLMRHASLHPTSTTTLLGSMIKTDRNRLPSIVGGAAPSNVTVGKSVFSLPTTPRREKFEIFTHFHAQIRWPCVKSYTGPRVE